MSAADENRGAESPGSGAVAKLIEWFDPYICQRCHRIFWYLDLMGNPQCKCGSENYWAAPNCEEFIAPLREAIGQAPVEPSPDERRALEAIEAEALAQQQKEAAEQATAEANAQRAKAKSLRDGIRRRGQLEDPYICAKHGRECIVDDIGAYSSGYLIHIAAEGKIQDTCDGSSIGRRSEFTGEELAAYRGRL